MEEEKEWEKEIRKRMKGKGERREKETRRDSDIQVLRFDQKKG